MNARALQAAVRADLERLFRDTRLSAPPELHADRPAHQPDGPEGEPPEEVPRTAPIRVFEQALPIREGGGEDPYPYLIVRLDAGGVESPTDPHRIGVLVLAGVYDGDRRNQGHRTVLELLERIQDHYGAHPTLDGGAFRFADPFRWALQDEPSYPYFYGACELAFTTHAPRTEGSEYT